MNAPINLSNVVLTTKRLRLRPWQLSDLEDLFSYASVPGVGEMAGWKTHQTKEESLAILTIFMNEKKTLAIEHEGKVIGSIGVEYYSEKRLPAFANLQCREIGYVLAKDYWGQGLMVEAVSELIRYLFEDCKLDVLLCSHFLSNNQSKRVIEKCGFQYYTQDQIITQLQTTEDIAIYTLIKEQWKQKSNSR